MAKKFNFLKLLAGGLLMSSAAFVAQPVLAQDASGMEKILSSKVVRVGAIEAFPYYKHDLTVGKWVGIIPDMLELMFGSIGVKVEYVPTDWGTASAGLQSNRFDLVGGYNATPQRALALDFSMPISQSRIGILTLKEPPAAYKDWSALNNPDFKVAAVDGASTTRAAQKVIPNASWTLVKASNAMVMELESGRVDAMISNHPTLLLYKQSKGSGHMVIPEPVVASPVNIAMRKNSPELREWLNVAVQYYEADGSLKAIWDKYLPGDK
ncbi:MAG: transporter substrate-binding domain-containing protein [Pusillimonas sp.]